MQDKVLHPSELILRDFLWPKGISAREFSLHTGIPSSEIFDIFFYRFPISAKNAMLIAMATGTTAKLWLEQQMAYDLAAITVEPIPIMPEFAQKETANAD